MKNKLIPAFLFSILIGASTASAQTRTAQGLDLSEGTQIKKQRNKELKEYRFPKTNGTLRLELGHVVIEGYKGNEVVLSTMVEAPETDSRAAGLQKINPSGLKDNTGLGLNIQEQDQTTLISHLSTFSNDTVFIKVPDHLNLLIKGRALWNSGNISLKKINGEIEVSQTHGNVNLIDITGPTIVKTNYGNIEAVYNTPVKGPISLFSNTGYIDAAFPSQINANIEMATTLGEIYAADDFNIKIDTLQKRPEQKVTVAVPNRADTTPQAKVSNAINTALDGQTWRGLYEGLSFGPIINNRIKGTINGGGEHIILRTSNGKVYLRTN